MKMVYLSFNTVFRCAGIIRIQKSQCRFRAEQSFLRIRRTKSTGKLYPCPKLRIRKPCRRRRELLGFRHQICPDVHSISYLFVCHLRNETDCIGSVRDICNLCWTREKQMIVCRQDCIRMHAPIHRFLPPYADAAARRRRPRCSVHPDRRARSTR